LTTQVLPKDDDLLTAKQSRAVLPFSLAWYAKNRWLGTGPRWYKIANRAFYRRSDLIAYVEANLRVPIAMTSQMEAA